MNNKLIFIKGNVPSLKNSKVKTSKGIFPSKTVTKYLRSLNIQSYSLKNKYIKEYKDPNRPNLFKEYFKNWIKPNNQVLLGFHFVRGSKHKFDFGNACQIIQDLMVAHDFIEDDNMNWLIPFPLANKMDWFSYNKENPGVWVKLLKERDINIRFDII